MPMTEDERQEFIAGRRDYFERYGYPDPNWKPTCPDSCITYLKDSVVELNLRDPELGRMQSLLDNQVLDEETPEPGTPSPHWSSDEESVDRRDICTPPTSPSFNSSYTDDSLVLVFEGDSLFASLQERRRPSIDEGTSTNPITCSPTVAEAEAPHESIEAPRSSSPPKPSSTEKSQLAQEDSTTLKRKSDSSSLPAHKKRKESTVSVNTAKVWLPREYQLSGKWIKDAKVKITGQVARDIGQQVRKRSKKTRKQRTRQMTMASNCNESSAQSQNEEDLVDPVVESMDPSRRLAEEATDLVQPGNGDRAEDSSVANRKPEDTTKTHVPEDLAPCQDLIEDTANLVQPVKEDPTITPQGSASQSIESLAQDSENDTNTSQVKTPLILGEGVSLPLDTEPNTQAVDTHNSAGKKKQKKKTVNAKRYNRYAGSLHSKGEKHADAVVRDTPSALNPVVEKVSSEFPPQLQQPDQLRSGEAKEAVLPQTIDTTSHELHRNAVESATPSPSTKNLSLSRKTSRPSKKLDPGRIHKTQKPTPNTRQLRSKTNNDSVFIILDDKNQPQRAVSAHQQHEIQQAAAKPTAPTINQSNNNTPDKWRAYQEFEARRSLLAADEEEEEL